ncbi:hypothetical protein M426DRAFT_316278 [Hypoxylon sp. CI-4A]|nr:hypothetical protein M426DRAFT_316278 [Hypoxylon sp. CI-4A]
MQHSDTDKIHEFFDGAVSTRIFNDPDYAYAFEATFRTQHPLAKDLFSQKPPLHFHAYQEEHIKVLSGRLVVEVEGREHVLSAADTEFHVRPWTYHRLFPPLEKASGLEQDNSSQPDTVVLLRGQKTDQPFHEDILFGENWYNYQNDIVMNKKPLSLIQLMSTFDAGGSYLALPRWIPFGKHISRIAFIVFGRWMGGLLGYQPYYRKWSTDWQLACEKMEASMFQRRFADRRSTE